MCGGAAETGTLPQLFNTNGRRPSSEHIEDQFVDAPTRRQNRTCWQDTAKFDSLLRRQGRLVLIAKAIGDR
jgi:hypothetical protein